MDKKEEKTKLNISVGKAKIADVVKRYKDCKEYQEDKISTLIAVKENPINVRYASLELKKDKEVGALAVGLSGATLVYLDESLQDDEEIVLLAVQGMATSFAYASERLKNDKLIAKTALQYGANMLKDMPFSIKDDKELVLIAVNKNPLQIEFASSRLRGDVEVAQIAYSLDRTVLKFIEEGAFCDKRFMQTVLKPIQNTVGANVLDNSLPIGLFKAIYEFGYKVNVAMQKLDLLTIERDKLYYLLGCIGSDFPKKQEVFKKYLEQDDGKIIKILLEKKVVTPAKAKSLTLYAINNKKIKVLPFLLNYTKGIKLITKETKESQRDKLYKSLLRKTATSVKTFKETFNLYKQDREMVKTAVNCDGSLFFCVADTYCFDQEIIMDALNNYVVNNADKPFLSVVSDSVKNNEELCFLACKKDGRNYFYLKEEFKEKESFIKVCSKQIDIS